MSFQSFAISQGIIFYLKLKDKQGVIKDIATKLDSMADENLKASSEAVQEQAVIHFLLPLARELMKESPLAYQYALSKERELVGGVKADEHRGESGKRQTFQPKL
jgi:hypothetical protein